MAMKSLLRIDEESSAVLCQSRSLVSMTVKDTNQRTITIPGMFINDLLNR